MDKPILRTIMATLGGLIVAMIVVGLVEMAGHLLFPPPDGLDITKPEDQARIMEVIPFTAKLFVVAAWFLGALAGAAVAAYVGRAQLPGWLVAGFMVLASVWTTQMFPHPWWMIAAALALPVAAKLLADRLMASRLSS